VRFVCHFVASNRYTIQDRPPNSCDLRERAQVFKKNSYPFPMACVRGGGALQAQGGRAVDAAGQGDS